MTVSLDRGWADNSFSHRRTLKSGENLAELQRSHNYVTGVSHRLLVRLNFEFQKTRWRNFDRVNRVPNSVKEFRTNSLLVPLAPGEYTFLDLCAASSPPTLRSYCVGIRSWGKVKGREVPGYEPGPGLLFADTLRWYVLMAAFIISIRSTVSCLTERETNPPRIRDRTLIFIQVLT